MTKNEALKALKDGYKVAHADYTEGEFLTMDDSGVIHDEVGTRMGFEDSAFWLDFQDSETGWSILPFDE